MKQIGGEIESNLLNCSFSSVDLNKFKSFYLLDSGRSALMEILSNKDLKKKKFLIPFYSCKSIVQPFIDRHIKFDFYDINYDLQINLNKIHQQIKKSRFDSILIVNYFGFTVNNEIVSSLKDRNIFILEDLSHMSFIPILIGKYNPVGDIVFGSLRKLLPVVDGGFILKSDNLKFTEHKITFTNHALFKAGSKILKEIFLKSGLINNQFEKKFLSLSFESEQILDFNSDKPLGISPFTISILSSLKFKEIFKQRRENYIHLMTLYRNERIFKHKITLLNNKLDDHILPYMFPVRVKENRNCIRQKLIDKKIFTPLIWELEKSRFSNRFPVSLKVSEELLCLPIDQRYNNNDMETMFDTLLMTIKNET